MRPLEDFYVHFGHFGHFQPQFSTYFAVNNSDRGQWQDMQDLQGNRLGGNLFLDFGM